MNNMWILAQTESGQAPSRVGSEPVQSEGDAITTVPGEPPKGADTEAPPARSPWLNLFPLILIMVVMYLLLLRGPRKQQQQQRKMVQSLKKNDRVRTIGGIFGTVVDVREGADEVILKVDESNNTKIRISVSAISKNLSEETKE